MAKNKEKDDSDEIVEACDKAKKAIENKAGTEEVSKKIKDVISKTEKALDKAADIRLEQIRKAMGLKDTDDTVRRADQHVAIKDLISTGMQELDRILTPMVFEELEKGGIPRGFVAEFFGPHAGGKSSLCMKLAAQVTQAGGFVLWIDAEGSFVPEWASRHGVDLKRCNIVEAGKTGEYFLEMVESVAAKGLVDLVVVDSVTALVPKEILETELEKEARVGAGAKMMTRALPRIVNAAKAGNTAVVFINQIRQKVGVMYGNPETTPYGEALKFYCSLRLRLSQVGSKSERGIMKGEDEIGIRTNVQIVKSRFGPPYRETVMPIYYSDVKPHPLDTIIDGALSTKIVKSRSKKLSNGEIVQTFTYGDIKVEGIDEFKKELNPELIQQMAEAAMAAKMAFDPEIKTYLKTLEEDPLGENTGKKKKDSDVDPLAAEEEINA